MIHPSQAQERMGMMKFAWVCIWVVIAAAEIGLALWYRSTTFLEIGSVAPFMVAYNLRRPIRVTVRRIAQAFA
jgi:hypothetical protein